MVLLFTCVTVILVLAVVVCPYRAASLGWGSFLLLFLFQKEKEESARMSLMLSMRVMVAGEPLQSRPRLQDAGALAALFRPRGRGVEARSRGPSA
jgi:hypothetical protein